MSAAAAGVGVPGCREAALAPARALMLLASSSSSSSSSSNRRPHHDWAFNFWRRGAKTRHIDAILVDGRRSGLLDGCAGAGLNVQGTAFMEQTSANPRYTVPARGLQQPTQFPGARIVLRLPAAELRKFSNHSGTSRHRIHAFGVRTRAAGRDFAITSPARTVRIHRSDVESGIALSPAFFQCAHDRGIVPAPGPQNRTRRAAAAAGSSSSS